MAYASSNLVPSTQFKLQGTSNPGTVAPIAISSSTKTGSAAPQGLAQAAPNPYAGLVQSIVNPTSTTGASGTGTSTGATGLTTPPSSTSVSYTPTNGGFGGGTAQTPEQIAAATGQTQNSGAGNSSTSSSAAPFGGTGLATNPTFPGLVSGLINGAQQSAGNQQALQSFQQAQDINNRLAENRAQEAVDIGNVATAPHTTHFAQGTEQAIANQRSGEQKALSDQLQGLSALYGTSVTGQGQQLGALNNAVGAAQPQLGSIGQVPFSPLSQGQGSVLGSTQPGGVAAAGNLLGQFQGAQTQGATQGNISSQQQTQVAQYQSVLQQGQNLQSQLSSLITGFGLNPSDVNAANAGIQTIARNTSSPQYQILSNYINEIANTYAQALTPPGGSATDTTRGIATGMLNATASGQSIMSVIQGMDNAVKAKIAGIPTTSQNTGSGGTSGTSGTPMFGSFN